MSRKREILSRSDDEGLIYSNRFLNSIIDASPEGIWVIDSNERTAFVNVKLSEMLGCSREEISCRPLSSFLESDAMIVMDKHLENARKGKKEKLQLKFKRNDGSAFSACVTAVQISSNENGPADVLLMLTGMPEEKEAESETLDAFFSKTPVGMVIYSDDNRYVRLNKLASDMYGLPADEALGKSIFEVLPPDLANATGARNLEVLKSNKPVNGVYSAMLPLHSDQAKKTYLHGFRFPVPLSGGKKGVGLVTIDITDRIEAESQRKTSEERFRTLADNISQMAWTADNTGKITWVNKRWYDFTGLSAGEMNSGEGDKIHHPEYSEIVPETYMTSITKGDPWEMTHPLRSKTGEFRWFLTRVLPIRDFDGNIIQWFGTNTDVTELRNTQKALEISEQRLKGIFEHAAIGICEVDRENRFISVNRRICEILGYSREELLGKKLDEVIYDITSPEDLRISLDIMEKLRKGEMDKVDIEKKYIRHDGSPIWVHVTVSTVLTHSDRRTIRTIEDITSRKTAEEALRESEERFRLLADNISQFAWIADKDGTVHWYNKRWFEYTGTTFEQVRGWGWTMVHHPEHLNRVLDNFRKAVKKGEQWEDTFPLRGKDGQYRWFLSRALPIRDEQGNISTWFGTNTDITDRLRVEEALQLESQKYLGLFNNKIVGLAYCRTEFDRDNNAVDYTILDINPTYEHLTGLTRDRIVGKKITEAAPGVSQDLIDVHNRVAITGEEARFEIYESVTDRWYEINVFSPQKGYFIALFSNISERKQAEEALHQSLAKAEEGRNILTALMEYVPLGITIADAPDVNIRMVSRYGQELLEKSNEEITGIPAPEHPSIWGVYHSDGVTPGEPEELPLSRATMKGEIVKSEEWYVTRRDGTLIPILCNAAPILDSRGQVTGGIIGWQDIGELKRIQKEMQQRNEELTRFVYTVSHDLKSPLITIRMFASHLKEDIRNQNTAGQDQDLAYIQNAAVKMERLLNELLELSRIGRKEQLKQEVTLESVARSAIDLLAGAIREKSVRVEITAPHVLLYGYTQRLIQLYQNLIDNAIKFMGEQPEPEIEIGAFKDQNNEVILFVRDNGSGIDPRYQNKVFGLFEKLDPATEGTGIGLALVKRIIEVHNGRIWFSSEGERRGTTFFFTVENTSIINKEIENGTR